MRTAAKFVMAHSSSEQQQQKKLRLSHPCPSSIWLPGITLLMQPSV
jgi:hypothetical protein